MTSTGSGICHKFFSGQQLTVQQSGFNRPSRQISLFSRYYCSGKYQCTLVVALYHLSKMRLQPTRKQPMACTACITSTKQNWKSCRVWLSTIWRSCFWHKWSSLTASAETVLHKTASHPIYSHFKRASNMLYVYSNKLTLSPIIYIQLYTA